MPRYIVTIRKPTQPQTYYLSRNGFRCYTAANVFVFRTLAEAQADREHFAAQMPGFELAIEQLPPRVGLAAGLLRARPVPA